MKFVYCWRIASLLLGTVFVGSPVFAVERHITTSSRETTADVPEVWCTRLAERLPGKTAAKNCHQSKLLPTGAHSVHGFPILARHVAPPAGKGLIPPVRVLLIGGIHGDEVTSSAVVFQWLQWMETPAAQDFEWRIAPVVNPDGLLARKPSRVNANGVDLNRNFPTPEWDREAPRYWKVRTRSDPRRFPGKAPLSEPESRWINEEMVRFRPDVIVSVHAPYGVLDFDGFVAPPSRFGRLALNKVGVYPGSLGNYSGLHKNVPVVTIELPHAQAMPPAMQTKRIWEDMLAWMKANVKPDGSANAMRTVPAPDSVGVLKPLPVSVTGSGSRPFSQQSSRVPSSGEKKANFPLPVRLALYMAASA